jgi:hypothetical protein
MSCSRRIRSFAKADSCRTFSGYMQITRMSFDLPVSGSSVLSVSMGKDNPKKSKTARIAHIILIIALIVLVPGQKCLYLSSYNDGVFLVLST